MVDTLTKRIKRTVVEIRYKSDFGRPTKKCYRKLAKIREKRDFWREQIENESNADFTLIRKENDMNKKVDELAKCPYCGDEDFHTFYYGTDTLHCHECNREFAIELQTTIVVKSAKIYDKQCVACDTYLHKNEIINGKCSKCGCGALKENDYKYSEFDIRR